MKKYICDKCGYEESFYEGYIAEGLVKLTNYLTKLTGYTDLCDTCNKVLERIISTNKKEAQAKEEQEIKEFVNQN